MRGPAGEWTPLSPSHLNLRVQSCVCPLPPSPWLWPLTHSFTHTLAIEDEYSGPKLEDGKVTITFMKELMQWYKDQKKLHRKCAYQVTPLSLRHKAVPPGWHHSAGC